MSNEQEVHVIDTNTSTDFEYWLKQYLTAGFSITHTSSGILPDGTNWFHAVVTRIF